MEKRKGNIMDITGTDVNTGAENRVSTVNNRLGAEPLGVPLTARQLTAGATSSNTALTVGVTRISLYARNADIRYSIGSTSQTATATSHFIGQNERLDIGLPRNPNIAVIRNATTDGILEVSELS